ncbi:phage minor head protein [Fulvimarina sp. 2208YS6-2-32]|uniref:Phage minor head protein n=1 Tax=Fulvimarina uroteuthidis TaxID=3098149 RepID=A0ABU5HYZ3_9HYPH|nr:phage minor head protein [Fulvimarina sp. 2208YS6-2-32]MDY8108260.1 phage minor head protein [Fulvimarina sp. 2208YS6-2-32]
MTHRDTIERLIAQFGDQAAEAFLRAVDDIKNRVTLRVVVEKLERGDIPGAVEAIGLDPVAFERLESVLAEAYAAGGQAEVNNLPILRDPEGARVIFRFGTRNTIGEQELRQQSSELVTRIVEDQREAIRAALSDGLSEGRNPRSTALDVVGRVSRQTNRREGGVIGLTAPQERFVASARAELASGDPEALRHYLTRTRRDKRFDATVKKAIEAGKPVPADVATRIVGRYSDRLLELRGEIIARTETTGVLNKGREDAILQQVREGKVAAQAVKKGWRNARDRRVRDSHVVLHGQTVGLNESFISPATGAPIRYPGDPRAPASERVGCRCFLQMEVDYLASTVRRFRAEAA